MDVHGKPVVSVVIPAYNYANFLRCTLRNVLLEKDVEADIIVVDDGSTDDTAQVAAEFKDSIKYIYQKNKGLPGARNTGMDAARGDFMVFLDADDLLYPGTLLSQARALLADPNAQLAICHNQKFVGLTPDGPFVGASSFNVYKEHLDALFCQANLAPVHAVMLRMQAARSIGYFDESLGALEDYDFFLRGVVSGYGITVNQDGLALYRQHNKSMSHELMRMNMNEYVLRYRVHGYIAHNKDFMKGKKSDAWIAHGSRCMYLAASFEQICPPLVEDMIKLGEEAFLSAAREISACGKNAPRTDSSEDYLLFFAIPTTFYLHALIARGRVELQRTLKFLNNYFPETYLRPSQRRALYYDLMKKNTYPKLYVKNFDTWELARDDDRS